MTKKKRKAVVVEQNCLSEGIYSMWLQFPAEDGSVDEARAGQFISMYCRDASRLLPRPISICEIDAQNRRLRVVYRIAGKGTEEFSHIEAGEELFVTGPLGNGFELQEGTALVIGGGIGIPPMLQLSKELSQRGSKVLAALGYRDGALFLKEEFEPYAKICVSTEDGSAGTRGNVIDAIRANGWEADVIYACGPLPMLRGVKDFAGEQGIKAWISMEERMACGIGACLACVCQCEEVDGHSHVHNKRVCWDGPVFDADEIRI